MHSLQKYADILLLENNIKSSSKCMNYIIWVLSALTEISLLSYREYYQIWCTYTEGL